MRACHSKRHSALSAPFLRAPDWRRNMDGDWLIKLSSDSLFMMHNFVPIYLFCAQEKLGQVGELKARCKLMYNNNDVFYLQAPRGHTHIYNNVYKIIVIFKII